MSNATLVSRTEVSSKPAPKPSDALTLDDVKAQMKALAERARLRRASNVFPVGTPVKFAGVSQIVVISGKDYVWIYDPAGKTSERLHVSQLSA